MSEALISINASGVNLLGVDIGLAPKSDNFEFAFANETFRSLTPVKHRQLRICDGKGLSWLVDLDLGLVLWFEILFGKFTQTKGVCEPANTFRGKVHFGPYTVQGPFSFSLGELIEKLSIPSIGVDLIPEGTTVRSALVGFEVNEQRSDAVATARKN